MSQQGPINFYFGPVGSRSSYDGRGGCSKCPGLLGSSFAHVRHPHAHSVLIAQQSHKQVLGADMRVAQTLGLFSRIRQYPPALIGEGKSTEVEEDLRTVVCTSTCLRMLSTEAWERRNRLVGALSSRRRPISSVNAG